MDHEDDLLETPNATTGAATRRILKVRLRQDHVIRLHELRILQGKSIASLLETILDDHFRKVEAAHSANGSNGNGHRAMLPPATRTEAEH